MADDRLHFLSIAELSRLIEGRQISPVEVTRSMLDRIGSWDFRYQSYATVTAERATAAAASAEAQMSSGIYLGPLHGVPVAVKDLCFAKGSPTMAGTPVLREHFPDFDATVVRRLEEAGAVLLG